MTIFDNLMSLPLFRGITLEQLSSFIEKTRLDFTTYQAGETVARIDDVCTRVKCVISGEITLSTPVCGARLVVHEDCTSGRIIGFESLFGMDNRLAFSAQARTRCGVMRFSKAHLMDFMENNRIVMLNSMNYLALYAQKRGSFITSGSPLSPGSYLAHLVNAFTAHDSVSVRIESPDSPVESCLSEIIHKDAKDDLRRLCDSGVLRMLSDSIIEVSSKDRLRDCLE